MEETTNFWTQEIPTLPQDLIIEILVRLPLKTLLKFRCVSKSWFSLLSNSEFHKAHVNFSIKNPKMTDYTLAAVATVSGLGNICRVYTINTENSSVTTVSKHGCPPKSLYHSAWILGSCNGLICLTTESFELMVLNPCTGKFNVFPDSMIQYEVGDGGCYVRYGFGYDGSSEDYKVVKMFSFPQSDDQEGSRHVNMVNVYSLKSNSWSNVQGFDSGHINGIVGVFANGALHWVCHISGASSSEIVTFDLATERHGRIALPSSYDGSRWNLGESRGCILACCNYEPNKVDMWVMKEYGVESSWTKLVTISSPVDHNRVNISPLFVAENGEEVLVKLGTELTLYNSRNGSFKRLADYEGDFLQVQVATYLESLTSPHT